MRFTFGIHSLAHINYGDNICVMEAIIVAIILKYKLHCYYLTRCYLKHYNVNQCIYCPSGDCNSTRYTHTYFENCKPDIATAVQMACQRSELLYAFMLFYGCWTACYSVMLVKKQLLTYSRLCPFRPVLTGVIWVENQQRHTASASKCHGAKRKEWVAVYFR